MFLLYTCLIHIQRNFARRGMIISHPIFPIKMELAKRAINVNKLSYFTIDLEYNSIFSF